MAEKRNGYLVSKALRTFMLASVLASLAQQLATMTDAIVVSNLIGPDAISAINVVAPIITLYPTISILFGIGGSILAAKALGRRDADEANSVFATSDRQKIYDLTGREVSKPTHGIYIKGGKKYIVK